MKLIFQETGEVYNYNPRIIKSGNRTIIEKSEQELTDLLSDILEEGETWQDKYRYLSLDDNGEVYLDMDRYEKEKENE